LVRRRKPIQVDLVSDSTLVVSPRLRRILRPGVDLLHRQGRAKGAVWQSLEPNRAADNRLGATL
jgi:hypothetical protein